MCIVNGGRYLILIKLVKVGIVFLFILFKNFGFIAFFNYRMYFS